MINAVGCITTERAEAHIRKMGSEANCSKTMSSYFSPSAVTFAPPTPTSISPGLYQPSARIPWPELPPSDFFYNQILDPQALSGEMDGVMLESQVEDTDLPSLLEHARRTSSISIPSLREIRELSSASSSTRPSTATHASDRASRECDTCTTITSEVAAYCLAMFSAHSDTAGISLALAEYLAWMRKKANLKNSTDDNVTSMLEMLESRAREVHEMAETRPWAAWHNLVEALRPLGRTASRFAELEENLSRHTAEACQFFQTDYDIRMALAEQRKSAMAELGLNMKTPTGGASDAPESRLDS